MFKKILGHWYVAKKQAMQRECQKVLRLYQRASNKTDTGILRDFCGHFIADKQTVPYLRPRL